jgi:hypothetical protein
MLDANIKHTMPRTTINLEGPVLAELKKLQKIEHKSLGQLVSELVAQGLSNRSQPSVRPLQWITKNMGQAAVDLDDKDALYGILENHLR